VYRLWRAPAWGSEGLAHLELLAEVLSGSRSARLDRRLVYDAQLATEVSAFVWDKELASDLVLQATVKPGEDPGAVESELDAVVRELVEAGPGEDELGRARTRILARTARSLERLGGFGGRSDVLAESQTLGGDPHAYMDHLATLQSASRDAVVASGREWLSQPHYTLKAECAPTRDRRP
jgi:zinc protease